MTFDHLIDPMSGRQHSDALERTLSGSSCGKVTRTPLGQLNAPSPVTRAEVEAAVACLKVSAKGLGEVHRDDPTYSTYADAHDSDSRWVASLLTRLFAERDEAVAALQFVKAMIGLGVPCNQHGTGTLANEMIPTCEGFLCDVQAAGEEVHEVLAKIGAVTP